MRTTLDCVPCIVGQAVQAPRRFTADPAVLERILRETMSALACFDLERTPPEMGGLFNQIMNRALGDPDPYLEEKRRFNALAVEQLPRLKQMIDSAADPFDAAMRLAIAANVIDFGAPGGRTDGALSSIFENTLTATLKGGQGNRTVSRLRERAETASDILYLTDNAGEIVIDRLFIEQLPTEKVTVVVRAGPAINDALLEDAEAAGLHELVTVTTSGVAFPGTPLAACPPEFRERFRDADLIISKGQGNYETLSAEEAPIFFLLVVKCRTVAAHLSCEVGDFIAQER